MWSGEDHSSVTEDHLEAFHETGIQDLVVGVPFLGGGVVDEVQKASIVNLAHKHSPNLRLHFIDDAAQLVLDPSLRAVVYGEPWPMEKKGHPVLSPEPAAVIGNEGTSRGDSRVGDREEEEEANDGDGSGQEMEEDEEAGGPNPRSFTAVLKGVASQAKVWLPWGRK